jgi:putative pyoverdin transport system ATP-binding/permease protein
VLLTGVLAFMVVGVLTYRLALRAGFERQRRAREAGDQLFGHLRGLTQGTKELKTGQRRREEFIRLLRTSAEGFRGMRVAAQRIFILASSWGNLLFFMAIGLILFLLPTISAFPREVRSGFILILLYMSGPLQVVLNSVPLISQANVAMQKIERLGLSLLEKEELQTGALADPSPSWHRLELVGVTHSYKRDDGSFILGPLDLVFHPGDLIFIVGGNGSGKTTFAKLLIGLYLPEAGEIRWNGEPVRPEHLELYRHLFTVVFSDFYLFEKLFGLSSPDMDTLAVEYLQKLRLEHRVRIEQGMFSTIELSQGQRKRLALLTAFLEDRPVYVFDEWAADQDPEFKEIFYRQILPRLRSRGKTIFVISHDDRYYDAASRIIKLDNGIVVSDQAMVENALA